jgi:DNA-binding NarL/FixJ family response regulator
VSDGILIADDNAAIRHNLRIFLELEPGLKVCGEAVDGDDAIHKAEELHPAVIILDFSMPKLNGLEASREIHRKLPGTSVILFTGYKGVIRESDARAAGIASVIWKGEDLHFLIRKIQTLLQAA